MTRAKGPLLTFLVVGGLVAAAVAGDGIVFSATFGGVVGLVAAVIWFRFAPAVREGYAEAGDVAADRRRLLSGLADLGEPVGALNDLRVFASPPSFVALPQDPAATEVLSWPITGEVQAGVEAVGAVSVTRGRNLAAKALGGALVPGGVFLFGNAKDRVHDGRELYLGIEGPDWVQTIPLHPDQGADARRFAQAINLVASRQITETPVDRLAALERLDRLRSSGTLTQEEFDLEKTRLLTE